ncbi:hypothetical protein JCM14469_01170 [Desulfatiferula olefinivorans]
MFLGLYLLLGLAAGILGTLLIRLDGSLRRPLPEPSRLSPLETAVLAGGRKDALRLSVFRLIEAGAATIRDTSPRPTLKRKKNKGPTLTDPLDRMVYEHLKTPAVPGDLFRDQALLDEVDRHLSDADRALTSLGLLRGMDDRFRIRLIMGLTVGGMGVIGIRRVIHGIVHDRPVGFLLMLMVVVLYVLYTVLRPLPRSRTRLGDRFLAKARSHFAWMEDAMTRGDLPEGVDPALPLSLFGPKVLAGLTAFALFHGAFDPAALAESAGAASGSSDDTGYGCGSGCGGGGCGGGCGGCD